VCAMTLYASLLELGQRGEAKRTILCPASASCSCLAFFQRVSPSGILLTYVAIMLLEPR